MKIYWKKYSKVVFAVLGLIILATIGGIIYADYAPSQPKKIHVAGCKEDVIDPLYYVGMASNKAELKAKKNGVKRYRVVGVGGKSKPVNLDNAGSCGYRINVTLADGKVTKAEYY